MGGENSISKMKFKNTKNAHAQFSNSSKISTNKRIRPRCANLGSGGVTNQSRAASMKRKVDWGQWDQEEHKTKIVQPVFMLNVVSYISQ